MVAYAAMLTAIILAAGQGTRMKSARPKVVHELCGRRMVHHVVHTALDAGAEDVARDEDVWVVTTEPASLHAVREALQAKRIESTEAAINWVPKSTVRVEGADAASLVKLIEALEDLDDVQKVEGNFDIDESALDDA